MRYKHFVNADVDVSALAVGTWAIGGAGYGEVDDQSSIDAIRAMIDGGVNLIDTAPVYGSGYSEKIVAKAIQGLDRSKLLIATKVGVGTTTLKHVRGIDPMSNGGRDASFANIMYECEQSLRRLGTDYIDFYFIHWPDVGTPIEESMDAFNTLKKQGKIRFIGVSNFNKEQILECEKYAKVDAIQPPYSMVVRNDEELMKWCVERGIATFTYGSLGAGILTGSFRKPPEFERDIRGTFYPFFREPYFSKVMKVLDVMDEISAETGKPLAQIAINWSTQKNYVSTALCGVRNIREAAENCATFDWTLNDDQIARLDVAIEKNIDFDGSATGGGRPLKKD